ncbi:uncharacterized protein BX663DRAFT_545760 [Cokeromyces recurvatus]|uniref:uncharacterized protein n=1 Tax=Cokeromyces recurvatus TaxID=90255 RepID=UPI00221FDB2E|nr:uncharacterized protein BX663DRAFT_545760 [Cokeromyces recurvatus]KAI7899424.1 hypothetical protein BX663DRAFT_545760 [Cokeromyces recurvatus]
MSLLELIYRVSDCFFNSLNPIYIQACVNKSWKTSMEVGVKVEAKSPLSHDRFFVAHAYLTFIALSPRPKAKFHLGRILSDFQPIPIPQLIPPPLWNTNNIKWLNYKDTNASNGKKKLDYKRPINYTFAEAVEVVMPQHANTLSITFGSQIMAWMETCAIASAKTYLLTASIDSLNFIASSGVGDVVTIHSLVSRSFNSSMGIYVSVESENLLTGKTNRFFTITALNDDTAEEIRLGHEKKKKKMGHLKIFRTQILKSLKIGHLFGNRIRIFAREPFFPVNFYR